MGVPLVKRLRAANETGELRIISFTGMIGSDTDDTPGEKARELGIEHAVALSDMYGEWTPYLNMNHMPGLTFAYVIGREGGVVWKGDISRDGDEFLDAVRLALAAPRIRPLPEGDDEELVDAVASYVEGDFAKARKLADKAASKFSKKKGDEAAAVAARARALVEAVDGTLADLHAAASDALESQDAERIARSLTGLRAAFPKSDEASAVDMQLRANAELSTSVDAWTTWLELEWGRPPTFPERREKLEKRYAKDLEKYLKKNADGPGAATARAWLERYAAGE